MGLKDFALLLFMRMEMEDSITQDMINLVRLGGKLKN